MYIYVYTNKINGHQYVGQTNNLEKRYRGHKSDSQNPNSHSYNYPLHAAIRKYGLDNFSFEIIEEVGTPEEADEREKYWIKEKHSHVSEGGYNISYGGDGCQKDPIPFDELTTKSKIFSKEEILDIQQRLVKGEKYDDIMAFYSPRLTRTFLSNINHGTNYKNPDLKYPLKTDFSGEGHFTKEQIQAIKQDIKSSLSYSVICKKYGIASPGFISMVNSGKYYYDPNEKYPLIVKGCANKSWIHDCLYDIIYSTESLVQIAKKYGKAESTVKKLAQGRANKQDNLVYPIRSHLEENRKIFK